MISPEIETLALALGVGLIVGLQREWVSHKVAGIRSFALISVSGALAGLLVPALGGWGVAAGFLAVAAILIQGRVSKCRDDELDPGLTTELAALAVYLVGVFLATGPTAPALVAGGVVAVLLQWKEPIHGFVDRIGEKDLRAIFQIVLIALVILPVLPDEDYGPYRVLNPFEIWMLVVLICGLSLAGYIGYKFLGPRTGAVVGGVFGGVISSTAATVSYSRRTRHAPERSPLAALVLMIASTIVFIRVILEVALVAPGALWGLAPPLIVMTGWMTLISVVLFFWMGSVKSPGESKELDEDPSDLVAAVSFGALYALVLFGVAWAKEMFGDRGMMVVAVLSGLTDMDAITLSTARFVQEGRVTVETGWRMILVGAMSNLVFKAGVAAVLGAPRLFARLAALFALSMAGGVALLVLWP